MNTLTKPENRTELETSRPTAVPLVDIYETKDAYILEAEIPGVAKDGLEVLLDNNELTIIGRRSASVNPGETLYLESRPADFRRVFSVDPTITTNEISAQVDQGLLTLRLPKAEKVKPRKITVTE
jgi:HSP20 family protein